MLVYKRLYWGVCWLPSTRKRLTLYKWEQRLFSSSSPSVAALFFGQFVCVCIVLFLNTNYDTFYADPLNTWQRNDDLFRTTARAVKSDQRSPSILYACVCVCRVHTSRWTETNVGKFKKWEEERHKYDIQNSKWICTQDFCLYNSHHHSSRSNATAACPGMKIEPLFVLDSVACICVSEIVWTQ